MKLGDSHSNDPGYSYININMKEFLLKKYILRELLTAAEHIYRPTWVCLRNINSCLPEFMTQHPTPTRMAILKEKQ